MIDNQKPRLLAMKKLSARMRTEKEIRTYLKEQEFSSEIIDDTIAFLKEKRYLDDENYVREYFRVRKRRGYAKNRIIRELSEKGISSEMARTVIEDFIYELQSMSKEENDGFSSFMDDEELTKPEKETALLAGIKMAENHLGSGKICDERFCLKVGRRLMSHGYDQSTCYYVMNKIRNLYIK